MASVVTDSRSLLGALQLMPLVRAALRCGMRVCRLAAMKNFPQQRTVAHDAQADAPAIPASLSAATTEAHIMDNAVHGETGARRQALRQRPETARAYPNHAPSALLPRVLNSNHGPRW